MTEPVYIPLKPGTKQPAVKGWADPDYQGVAPEGRVGLRADGLVIVDCDTEDAYTAWTADHPPTYTVKTPNGWHCYYSCDEGFAELVGPSVKPMPGTDIRAGKGSFVVAPPTEGYAVVGRRKQLAAWRPEWLPERTQPELIAGTVDEWDEIPVGQQNSTLAALAGTLRRQGASAAYIYAALQVHAEAMPVGDSSNPWTNEDLKLIARSVSRYEPDPDQTYEIVDESGETAVAVLGDAPTYEEIAAYYGLVCYDDMDFMPPAEWWWKPYLPKERLVLLDGDSGIGKGLMCAHMAEMLVAAGARVLWASTEDDPEEDIQRRLAAAGLAKGGRGVHFFTKDPRFPTDVDLLEELIVGGRFEVIILDPGRSFLDPPKGTPMSYNDDAAVRYGLESIQRMAKRVGCTIIFVHHWNKDTQQTTKSRSGGSSAFTQVPRHRVALAWHGPSDGGSGAFEVVKSNIGPTGGVHGYQVEAVPKHDTARFMLGERMPEYNSLGAWMKAQEQDEKAVAIDRTDEIRAAILALPAGTKIVDSAIAIEAQSSMEGVNEVVLELIAEGQLRKVQKVLVRTDAD